MAYKNEFYDGRLTFFLLGSVYSLLAFVASISFAATTDMHDMMGLIDTSSCPSAATVYAQVSAGTLTKAQGDAKLQAECPQLFTKDPMAGKTTTSTTPSTTTTPTKTTTPTSTSGSKFTLPTDTSTPTTSTTPKKKSSFDFEALLKDLEEEPTSTDEAKPAPEAKPKSRFSLPAETDTEQKIQELQEKLKTLEAKKVGDTDDEEAAGPRRKEKGSDDETEALKKKILELEGKLVEKEKQPTDKERLSQKKAAVQEIEQPPVSKTFTKNVDKFEIRLEDCASLVKDKTKFKKCAEKIHKLTAGICKDPIVKGEALCKNAKKAKKLAPKKALEYFSTFLEVLQSVIESSEEEEIEETE